MYVPSLKRAPGQIRYGTVIVFTFRLLDIVKETYLLRFSIYTSKFSSPILYS